MLSRFVVSRRDRPGFSLWRNNTLTRYLRDTLNESWDPEPDARLTSLCIYQRLVELKLENCHSTSDSSIPLEPISTTWTGRNCCLERNLNPINNTDNSNEYLILMSEKHKPISSTTTTNNIENSETSTQNTELSLSTNNTNIPFLQNF